MKREARILVVEDEPAIAELVAVHLKFEGFEVVLAEDATAAQRELDAVLPDAILLDWMLPGESGLSLARRWRADARTRTIPILMVTARGDEADKVAGLDAGADDYLTKPFSPKEMLARIRAVLRRRAPDRAGDKCNVGLLTLDPASYRVEFRGQPLKLNPTEFRLLQLMMAHPERVFTRTQILDRVWGDHVYIEERTVDVHMRRLRIALGEAAAHLETVRGAGYRISATPAPDA